MREQHFGSDSASALQAVAVSVVLITFVIGVFALAFAGPPSRRSSTCTDDSWTPTNTANAPSARSSHTAVGGGRKMFVWGGDNNTGERYNPVTDSWIPTSTIGAPTQRWLHTEIWPGSKMIVGGGKGKTPPPYLN